MINVAINNDGTERITGVIIDTKVMRIPTIWVDAYVDGAPVRIGAEKGVTL